MKRKRFIKLCMANGMSRMGASNFAKLVQSEQKIRELHNSTSRLTGQLERIESISYAEVAQKMCLARRRAV